MPISDYFKKASEKIKTEVNDIKDKANTAYKKNKLNNELEEMYSVLGRIRFSELSEGTENRESSERIFEEIKRITDELKDMGETEQPLENICKHCGKYVEDGAVYCPYCGNRINDVDSDGVQ